MQVLVSNEYVPNQSKLGYHFPTLILRRRHVRSKLFLIIIRCVCIRYPQHNLQCFQKEVAAAIYGAMIFSEHTCIAQIRRERVDIVHSSNLVSRICN